MMSKTAALAEARSLVHIYGRGTSWTVSGPYHYDKPHGPSTEHNVDSYAKAVRTRTCWRAYIALTLMGRASANSMWFVFSTPGSLEDIVNGALKETP